MGATWFSGLLAGASADRYLVQVPAWRRLDPMIWAEHSRHADLGNGRFWYPILAFGATGLSVAAAIGVYRSAEVVQGLAGPVYLGAVVSFLGLAMTALAAPHLLRLRRLRDRLTTEASFRAFHGWGLIRAGFQILAFPVNLWALYVLSAQLHV
jgi:hypothetical protein